MKYFPEITNYDMDTCAGKAQYLAHIEIEPIKLLIEHTQVSLDSSIRSLGECAQEYDRTSQFKESCDCSNVQMIMAARVAPLAYQSIILILMSLMEESFKCWCRMIEIVNDSCPNFAREFKSKRKGELEKSFDYLQKYTQIKDIESDEAWEKIRAIRTARNAVVHHGGRVPEKSRELLEKYNIGMREEDNSVYIDEDTMNDIYDTVVAFIDRIFEKGVALEKCNCENS